MSYQAFPILPTACVEDGVHQCDREDAVPGSAAISAGSVPVVLMASPVWPAHPPGMGRSSAFILGTWTICAVLLIFAMVVSAGPLSSATPETLSLHLAFAAGAVLAALADTIMPEAYQQGRPTVALSTAAGFVLSFVLSTL